MKINDKLYIVEFYVEEIKNSYILNAELNDGSKFIFKLCKRLVNFNYTFNNHLEFHDYILNIAIEKIIDELNK